MHNSEYEPNIILVSCRRQHAAPLMAYQEFSPHPALRPYVACLWASQAAAGPSRHRVLPDNCVDILWQDSGGEPFAVGMMSAPIWVPTARPVRTVAVRFKPAAAALFLGVPLHPLADTRAGLPELWGRSETDRLNDALWQPGMTTALRLHLVEAALLARLAGAGPVVPSLGVHAVAAIEASHGTVRIEQLAAALDVSRQHFSLRFRQQVGIAPKLFARICRFRQASALLVGPADVATVAAQCGYFDQSHLIRDFHDFAGTTPDAWR